MKSRIELYTPRFRPQLELINPAFVAFIWVMCLLAIVALGFSAMSERKAARTQLAQVKAELDSQQTALAMLTTALEERQPSETLLEEIERHNERLGIKEVILAELDSRETQHQMGFSSLMYALAKHHHRELWLTSIRLDEESFEIEGQTLDSTAVPQWLKKLGQAEYFQGKEFATVSMNRTNSEHLHFVLSSELAESAGLSSNQQDVAGDGK